MKTNDEHERRIVWERLASEVGLIEASEPGVRNERGGNAAGRAALERIVGPARLIDAVEHYVAMAPGFELARSVLRLLRPWSAMAHCHGIFRSRSSIQTRRSAVELLRTIADRRALPWVLEFLADGDPEIQYWGISLVLELSYTEALDPDHVAPILDAAREQANERVREVAREIAGRLRE